jgi:hypothetical protein
MAAAKKAGAVLVAHAVVSITSERRPHATCSIAARKLVTQAVCVRNIERLDAGSMNPHTSMTMRDPESKRASALVGCACAAVLGLGAVDCIGPGLEPPGGENERTAARAAAGGSSAAATPGPTAASTPNSTNNPAAEQPRASGSTPPMMAPTGAAGGQSAAPATPGTAGAATGGAATAGAPGTAARDEDAGVE